MVWFVSKEMKHKIESAPYKLELLAREMDGLWRKQNEFFAVWNDLMDKMDYRIAVLEEREELRKVMRNVLDKELAEEKDDGTDDNL